MSDSHGVTIETTGVSAGAVTAARRAGERADAVYAPTYPPFGGRVFVDGHGCRLVDAEGRSHLDMTSGIAVLALGHRSPVVAEALRRAADGLIHTSNLFCTAPGVELADALVARSFADRVFLCNSGTEAVEAALKFARLRAGAGRRRLLYTEHAFHGRTLGALAATDKASHRDPFGPLPPAYDRIPFDDPDAFAAIDEQAAAVIVEPVQGEGGLRPASVDWLRGLRNRCDETGTLLILDEIQCGLGRTGRMWAHEHAGIEPDLMTIAKPLGGGLPIGAVLMRQHVADAITPGCHGTTFGGGPAVATVALAVLNAVAEEPLLAGVRRKGELLRAALEGIDHPRVREVRGRGLMLGVEVDGGAGPVVAAAADRGLLLVAAGPDTIRFLPPLNAGDENLLEAAAIFGAAIAAATSA